MLTTTEAKALACELARTGNLKHSQVLEAVAHASGFADWNTYVGSSGKVGEADLQGTVHILRIFDPQLPRGFYVDFLGFGWRWQHQFDPGLPVYAQVERRGRVLHLSEHHGDASPGGAVMITGDDLDAYHAELAAQSHRNARPGIEDNLWGRTMTVLDPFSNRLVFWQRG